MSFGSLASLLFGRRRRHADDKLREQVCTFANGLTVLRACVTSVIFVLAIVLGSHPLLLSALAISMLMDFLDGFAARSSERETLLGAQLDGLADRLAAVFVVVGVISMHPGAQTIVAAALVWFQFGVVDQFLTSQFLRFGLWSPDHFYEIDERVWWRNWSPLAKLASNTPIALLALGSWLIWPALALALLLIVFRLRAYPAIRDHAEQLPELRLAYEPRLRARARSLGPDSSLRRAPGAEEYAAKPLGVVAHR